MEKTSNSTNNGDTLRRIFMRSPVRLDLRLQMWTSSNYVIWRIEMWAIRNRSEVDVKRRCGRQQNKFIGGIVRVRFAFLGHTNMPVYPGALSSYPVIRSPLTAMAGSRPIWTSPFRNLVSLKEAFEGLELGEGKLSQPVLRGPGGRKAAWPLDSKVSAGRFISHPRERRFWTGRLLRQLSQMKSRRDLWTNERSNRGRCPRRLR